MNFILKFVQLLPIICWVACTSSGHHGGRPPGPPDMEQNDVPKSPIPDPIFRFEDLPEDLDPLSNLPNIINNLGLGSYHQKGYHGQGIKVAIFDNGFTGLNHSLGQRLPPGLKIEPAKQNELINTTHGTKLAEIVYAVATGQNTYDPTIAGPNIFLFNTNGFTNLTAAIDGAIAAKIDIILYAQVWEYGGNFDGTGFINREVTRATNAGILWVNAAGNMGQSTYTGALQVNDDRSLVFAKNNAYQKLIVPQKDTGVRIVLSWSDFENTRYYKTKIDLDLFLENSAGKRIGESRLVQGGADDEKVPGFSAHAREVIETTLDAGIYYIKGELVSGLDSDQTNLKIRVMVDGNGVRLPDGTPQDSLPIPADNPAVFAVGASDVDDTCQGPHGPSGLQKPEVTIESEVVFGTMLRHHGTSAASAIVAGSLSVLQSAKGHMQYDDMIKLFNTQQIQDKNFKLPGIF